MFGRFIKQSCVPFQFNQTREMAKYTIIKGKVRIGTNLRPRRTGLLARKIGMLQAWDDYGIRRSLTVLQLESCHVTEVKTSEKHGFNAIQVGVGDFIKEKHVSKPIKGICRNAEVPLKRWFTEFRVTQEGLLPRGTELKVSHFVPGQYVDVQGTSIGKGFQGGMKRWGMKGQPASHGVSKTHRSIGSTGACQDPGRVFPGKKMPGRMGGKTVTVQNLWIFKIDTARNLLYVQGHIPGNKGELVRIRDAVKKCDTLYNGDPLDLKFPTNFDEPEAEIMKAPLYKENPLDKVLVEGV